MSDVSAHHDEDFVTWSREQADALRAAGRGGSNQTLDWENLAEEIESLGKSERHTLKSQIQRVVEHLLKLQHSPAVTRELDGSTQLTAREPKSNSCWTTVQVLGQKSVRPSRQR